MAADLKDFRGKITEETYLALEAEALAFDRTSADVLREVMHAWALKKIHEASVLSRLMRGEGVGGAGEGSRGNEI